MPFWTREGSTKNHLFQHYPTLEDNTELDHNDSQGLYLTVYSLCHHTTDTIYLSLEYGCSRLSKNICSCITNSQKTRDLREGFIAMQGHHRMVAILLYVTAHKYTTSQTPHSGDGNNMFTGGECYNTPSKILVDNRLNIQQELSSLYQ